MKFSYDHERHILSLAVQGGEVEIGMISGHPEWFNIDGYEFNTCDEISNTIYVNVDGEMFTLRQILTEAAIQYSSIVGEAYREGVSEMRHIGFLSSPQMTGRIG